MKPAVAPVKAANGGKTTALIETSPQPFMKKGHEAPPFKPEVKLPADASAKQDMAKEKKGKTVATHLADV